MLNVSKKKKKENKMTTSARSSEPNITREEIDEAINRSEIDNKKLASQLDFDPYEKLPDEEVQSPTSEISSPMQVDSVLQLEDLKGEGNSDFVRRITANKGAKWWNAKQASKQALKKRRTVKY